MADSQVRTRPLGKSGIEASIVGLGTWAIGGWMWGGTDEQQSIAAIQASIDEGISLIDTAPAYGMGLSETIVGRAIKGRRDKVVLATKCGLVWHTTKGTHFFDQDGKPVHRYLGADSIAYEVEQSLRRLGTDHIDHYITHWQDATTPIDEIMQALIRLKEQGKIRSIGASNVSPADLRAYVESAAIDAIQEEYSMVARDIEGTLLPIAMANDVSVLSYSSLALGLLSGKVGPERVFAEDDQRRGNPRFSQDNRRKVAQLTNAVLPLAEARNVSMAQLVIAWTVHQPGITFSLCGARDPAQARENAAAARLTLSDAEVASISEAVSGNLINLDH